MSTIKEILRIVFGKGTDPNANKGSGVAVFLAALCVVVAIFQVIKMLM